MDEKSIVGEGGEERQQWRRGSGKKKRRISTEMGERSGGKGMKWREGTTTTNERGGEKEEEEAEAGNLESTIHSNPGY